MVTSEIYVEHGLPRYIQTFTDDLQQLIHDKDGRRVGNDIKPSSTQRYAHRLYQRVNRNKEGVEG